MSTKQNVISIIGHTLQRILPDLDKGRTSRAAVAVFEDIASEPMTVVDASRILGCHPQSIRRRIGTGEISAINLSDPGRRPNYRIRLEHVIWLRDNLTTRSGSVKGAQIA